MFNNFINFYDIKLLFSKVIKGRLLCLFSKLIKVKNKRIKDTWEITEEPPSWWTIPQVTKRFNYLITGNENIEYHEYISKKYFSQKQNLIALSLGCGNGKKEIKWMQHANFKEIKAYDISEKRINFAKEQVIKKGLGGIIDYQIADIYDIEFEHNHYDLVFTEQSLHHFSPLESLMSKINKSLKHDGCLIANEFIGPSRFQWTKKQLQLVKNILGILPEKYKINAVDGSVKKVFRPSKLRMIVADPSEAVESNKILPLLEKHFNIVEIRPYAGAILHLLLDGIAPAFSSDEKNSERYLRLLFEIEDLLTEEKQVQSDFALAVCQKKM